MLINKLPMDPWKATESEESQVHANAFEDNFRPTVYDKLPDSDEYLAGLEAKLNKIKADPNVLKQLAQKREECMNQLLNGDISCDSNLELDEPIEHSTVMRTIAPQKQALTQGEIMELVKYDQLQNEDDDLKPENKNET